MPSVYMAEDDDDAMLNGQEEPAAEDYLVEVGELEGDGSDDDQVGLEDDGEPPAWYSSQQRMEEMRNQYKRHEKDTGSPEYQVAGMTERITYLTAHLKQHPKDFSTRRGLVALVNKRRRLLNYLARESEERYIAIVKGLGIRHKAPSAVPNRVEQYGRFPGQKAVKKHLVKK